MFGYRPENCIELVWAHQPSRTCNTARMRFRFCKEYQSQRNFLYFYSWEKRGYSWVGVVVCRIDSTFVVCRIDSTACTKYVKIRLKLLQIRPCGLINSIKVVPKTLQLLQDSTEKCPAFLTNVSMANILITVIIPGACISRLLHMRSTWIGIMHRPCFQ